MNQNKTVITLLDVVGDDSPYGNDQGLCQLLKEKGAPILGTLALEPDLENYYWYKETCPITNEITFSWHKKTSD